MNYLKIVQISWVALGVIISAGVVIEIVNYFKTDHLFDQSHWQIRRIVVLVIVDVVVFFNLVCIGREGIYTRISVIVISLLFGFYGVSWLALGGEGHILWRIGFPAYLIFLCVCTLIVQKRLAKYETR